MQVVSEVKMKLYLVILILVALNFNGAKLITTKALKSKQPQNAIIAIQIIDPNENKTDSKNSKRTIESSLGYGYQGNFLSKQSSPKYEVYKYSQHDIPAYTTNQYTAPSASYHVPSTVSKPVHNSGISNFYQPGTILFSTINQHGRLGELSTQFPSSSLENQQFPIPVIILRVHPDQLANPLYPKLPQNHLHASTINSLDINSLLSSYIGNSAKQQTVGQQQPVAYQTMHQQSAGYQQQPVHEESPVYEQQYQQDYQNSQGYAQPQADTAQYQSSDYQSPDYQSSDYQSQKYYPQYQYEETQDAGQSYQSQQDVSALPEPRTPDNNSNYQYSSYQVPSPVYQQSPSATAGGYKSTDVLIDENYPSEKHTQVIFKRSKGKSATRNKQVHRSAPQVHSTKSDVSQKLQSQIEKIRQPSPKDYQQNTNYYTIQYSDDEGYSHQKAPSYGEKDRYEEPYRGSESTQSQNYVYISSNPKYNPHV